MLVAQCGRQKVMEKWFSNKGTYLKMKNAAWVAKKLHDDVRAYPSILVKSITKLLMMTRICVVHYQRNFMKAFQGPNLKALMMRAINTYNTWAHRKAMEALHKLSPIAHNWLLHEPKEHWCGHLFPTFTKFNDSTTNFVETLNNVLNIARVSYPWSREKPRMRKPIPKSNDKRGRPRKQVVIYEAGPLRSQSKESTDLGARPYNSQPTIATTTSPRRFTEQMLLQAQKSKTKKQTS
ncbi:hypothetical protein Cgig2_018364 [Carnegiea gigantea]|uniref:Uncharacterized protein n=1 Tax=Carnegiea gigantea TaxID=171969 RepID=A0A9Q1JQ48_9CARY|nr:hypothetical protein Cgig2_018364 [Carnegiea gigantea]